MSKHKNQRIISDKETKMLRLWQSAISPADSFYAQMSESVFRGIKATISEMLVCKCENGKQLSSCDAQIGDYYKKLTFYYANSLRLLNNAGKSPGTEGAMNILGGMTAVIMSRLKAFDGEKPPLKEASNEENLPEAPVITEKNRIIQRHVQTFLDNFDIVSYRTKSELFIGMFHETRSAFITGNVDVSELYRKCVQIAHNKGFPAFYELYGKTMKALRDELSGFFSKNAAIYYSGELFGEHEILKSLATVQVPALLREAGALPAAEKSLTEEAAESLLLAHRLLSRDVDSITRFLQSGSPEADETDSFEGFAAALLNAASQRVAQNTSIEEQMCAFADRLCTMRQSFISELRAAAAGWQGGGTDTCPTEAAKRMVDDEIDMAKGIRAVFADIHACYDGDNDLKADGSTDGRISQGIAETVLIKTESLDESIAALEASMRPLLVELEQVKEYSEPEWFSELAETSFDAMVDEMARFQKEDRRALSAVKKYMNFSKANEVYAAYIGRAANPAETVMREIEGKLAKFLKEQTLYEISTFEEIQLYSVSRLRESGAAHVAGFVICLDKACGKITDILARYGITPIKPEIRDIFNGREHEVLTAEQNGDFNKGEIIKLLNSGYKRGGTVVLRANVIAAR